MSKDIKTFEDFQKKKEEQLSKRLEVQEEKEINEEEATYPELFAFLRPKWILEV